MPGRIGVAQRLTAVAENFRRQNPAPRSQKTEDRIRNTEYGIRNTEYGIRNSRRQNKCGRWSGSGHFGYGILTSGCTRTLPI
jgi:hypothetical protein